MRAWLLFVLLLALLALVWTNGWRPPDRYNPWAPLDLNAEPDAFLRYKLHRLGSDPAMCRAAISAAVVPTIQMAWPGITIAPTLWRASEKPCAR